MDYKKMNMNDIINWCVANGEVAWLKEQAKKKPSFLIVKKAFAEKFMPEIIPTAKKKNPTWWEQVDAL